MVKTNRKSVEVLDEAKDMERRLDWILFKAEQEQQLAYREGEWNVGDFLYYYPDWEIGEQYARPMISELDINIYTSFNGAVRIRCEDCETYWRGDDPCWVCGAVVPDRVSKTGRKLQDVPYVLFDEASLISFETLGFPLSGIVTAEIQYIGVGPNEPLEVEYDARTLMEWVRDDMTRMFHEELQRTWYAANSGVNNFREQLFSHAPSQDEQPETRVEPHELTGPDTPFFPPQTAQRVGLTARAEELQRLIAEGRVYIAPNFGPPEPNTEIETGRRPVQNPFWVTLVTEQRRPRQV